MREGLEDDDSGLDTGLRDKVTTLQNEAALFLVGRSQVEIL